MASYPGKLSLHTTHREVRYLMKKQTWQLDHPINAVVFDCDSTLSTIEGIDELAKHNGVGDEVESMTTIAMNNMGFHVDFYTKRLNLVSPKRDQLIQLGQIYYANQVLHANQVIQTLKRLQKNIYVVSAGLYPAVKAFGESLQIPGENIYAVNIHFDEQGNYLNYEHDSNLIGDDGKRGIVAELKARHEHIIHVGDGTNDIAVHDLVTRFIGFGGVAYREKVAALSQYYIHTPSIAPLLPLSLTQPEYEMLLPEEKEIYHQGLAAIHDGKVVV